MAGNLLDKELNPEDLPYVIKAVFMLSARWQNIHTCLRITHARGDIARMHPRIPMRCLITVLGEWLNYAYDMKRDRSLPTWRKIVWFVKEETGGSSAAQAYHIEKSIAELSTFKPGMMAETANAVPLPAYQDCEASEPLIRDVAKQLTQVGASWFEMGVLLGVPVDTLEKFRQSVDASYSDLCLQMIVREWLKYFAEKPERRTWQILVDAVEHPAGGKNRRLAKKLADYSNSRDN